ncbi:MAG: ShlB/FhaC/HecB family hemolysin secretion/activation protein, partial [Cyanobacteria bacterium J06559_3]
VVQDDGFDLTAFIDNDRSPSVGSFRQGIALSQANLLGIGDRLSLGFNSTEGSNEFSAGYTIPINARNGTIGFNFTSTDSEVIEEPFTVLDIFSDSTTYELFYRQPLIQTPTQEFALSLRASHRESQAEFLETINDGEPIPFSGTGADAEGRTRVTALRFGQEWISRNSEQVIALLSEFSFGLDLLDATIQPVAPDGRFFLWRGQGQWVRSLGPDSLFILRGNVQLADRPLLPNEQFSFGGQRAGRGYRLNTLLRDNGWFLSTEFRFPLFRVPEQNIVTQIAPFFEVGGGWNEGAIPETEFLTSTGLGLIFQLDDDLTARLDWAIPLSDFETTGNSLQDSGIYFSIQATPF